MINNLDIDKVELYSLRTQIGIVPQEPLLFAGSVKENIALSEPDADINDIVSASNDIYLQSIRVHKFLTSTGEMGKVATAKFLDSIDLTENTKLIELNNKQIDAIIEYVKR